MEVNSERLDIRMPVYLLKEIEKYQERENIPNRTTTMLELIRIGLNTEGVPEVNVKRGDSQRIDIRVPIGLINKIEKFKNEKNINTRAAAMKVLVLIGLESTSIN